MLWPIIRPMTRDYARRSKSPIKPARKSKARRPSAKRATVKKATQRNTFNAPSFSAGAIFGAALILLVSYAPDVFQDSVSAVRTELEPPPEDIVFEFEELLEKDRVATDPDAYPASFPDTDPTAAPTVYLIQASSLRNSKAAASLQAQLTAQGLPADYEKVVISSGTWYRVTVGPFTSRSEANHALTRLREQRLVPTMIKTG